MITLMQSETNKQPLKNSLFLIYSKLQIVRLPMLIFINDHINLFFFYKGYL